MIDIIQEAKYVESNLIQKYALDKYDISNEQKSQFVGFSIKDDILISLPKHYCDDGMPSMSTNSDENLKLNAKLITNVMIKYVMNNSDSSKTHFGKYSDYESNFPFSSFYNIYNYYVKNGIYKINVKKTKVVNHGKVDWKKTIKRSDKIITEEGVIYYDLYKRTREVKYDIVSDLMVYAINYSISKLSFILDFRPIEYKKITYLEHYGKDNIIKILSLYKRSVFSDDKILLVNSLIDFYNCLNNGGNYYIKVYNFQNIWERMVEVYLNNYFISADHEQILFSNVKINNLVFNKKAFIVDVDGKKIELDHYAENCDKKYIFDSKYYEEIRGINYKQLSYQFLLTNFYGDNDPNVFCESVLFLPGSGSTEKNYDIKREFRGNHEMVTYEFYLNVHRVMLSYINAHFS